MNDRFPSLDEACSKHFVFRDFIECGETQARTKIPNLPAEFKSYDAIRDLAVNILDRVVDRFGRLELTYGFSSPILTRAIPASISPSNDQHAAYEKRRNGSYVCMRMGAACDFRIKDSDMREVAEWAYFNTPVDRLYFYGCDRPIHVSYSHKCAHQFVEMLPRLQGRPVPRVVKLTPKNVANDA